MPGAVQCRPRHGKARSTHVETTRRHTSAVAVWDAGRVLLVFVHGPAAAGKLTTARELSGRLGFPVFHNHLVVDLLTTVFPFGSPAFVRLREEFWLSVFRSAAESGRSLIFTFTPEATVAAGFPERARTAVVDRSGTVLFVRLGVSEEEQGRRIANPDRREFHKLVDPSVLQRLRQARDDVEQPPIDWPLTPTPARRGRPSRPSSTTSIFDPNRRPSATRPESCGRR